MALIKCPECGKEISDKAKVCIHCGYPLDLLISEESVSEKNETVVGNEIGEINSVVCVDTAVLEPLKQDDNTEEISDTKTQKKKAQVWKLIFAGVVVFSLIVVLLAYKPIMYATAMSKFESGEYERAVEIFNGMLDYSESEKYYEECRKHICADYAFLEDLEVALYNRMKYPDNQEQITETELKKLEKYEDKVFYDDKLKQYAKNYIKGLRSQSDALEMDFIDRKIKWTTGKVTRFAAIEALYSKYDLCKGQYSFELAYLGQTENAKKELKALNEIKTDLNKQLDKITSITVQNKKALVPLKNNTEYEYDMLLYLDYYDSSDNKIDEDYQIIVDVTSGEKINGKVPCPSSWDTCWIHFDVDNLEF